MDVDNILSIITGKDEVVPQRAAPAKYQSRPTTGGSDSSGQAKQRGKGQKKKAAVAKKKVEKVPKRYRTLFALIEGMVGCAVAVELKDDSIAEGLLYEVLYPSCDMTLTNVNIKGIPTCFEKFRNTVHKRATNQVHYFSRPFERPQILKKAEQRLRVKKFYGRTSKIVTKDTEKFFAQNQKVGEIITFFR